MRDYNYRYIFPQHSKARWISDHQCCSHSTWLQNMGKWNVYYVDVFLADALVSEAEQSNQSSVFLTCHYSIRGHPMPVQMGPVMSLLVSVICDHFLNAILQYFEREPISQGERKKRKRGKVGGRERHRRKRVIQCEREEEQETNSKTPPQRPSVHPMVPDLCLSAWRRLPHTC